MEKTLQFLYSRESNVSLSRFSAAHSPRLRFCLRYHIYTKTSSITDQPIQQIKNKQGACLLRSCFEGTTTTHINADTTYQYSESLFPNNFSAGGTVIVQIAGQEMERTIKPAGVVFCWERTLPHICISHDVIFDFLLACTCIYHHTHLHTTYSALWGRIWPYLHLRTSTLCSSRRHQSNGSVLVLGQNNRRSSERYIQYTAMLLF